MDAKTFIEWLLGIIATNVVVIVGAYLLWRKNSKMLPKELKGAELKNAETEATIIATMQDIAKNAALQVLSYQEQLQAQNREIDELKKQVEELCTIKAEFARLKKSFAETKQENKILREWSKALVEQVRKYETPVPMPEFKRSTED